MAVLLKLFCLVDGESTSNAFELTDIPGTCSVSTLKKLIKAEKTNDFQNVDADKLQLWRVSLSSTGDENDPPIQLDVVAKGKQKKVKATAVLAKTIGDFKEHIKPKKTTTFSIVDVDHGSPSGASVPAAAAVDDDNDNETPIELNNVPIDDKKKLSNPRTLLSSLFPESPDNKTYILVERPSLAPPNSFVPEIVALRKQLSDMTQLNENLKNTSISLPIVEKRGGKKFVCTYTTDCKQATVEQLRTLLHDHFEQFDGDDFVEIYVHQPGILKPVHVADDVILRACLQEAKEKGWKSFTISLDSPAKQFSAYDWNDVVQLYDIRQEPEQIPEFDIQPKSLLEDEINVLNHIVQDCKYMNNAYILGPSASEATKSSMVNIFMTGAMQLYHSEMFLAQQRNMTGRRGHGPVDYAVIDRNSQNQVLGVTEVKKEDFAKGLAQNMVQLDVAVQQKKRKRAEEDDDDDMERPQTRLKSYGIVTDSFKWTLVECTLSEDDTLAYRTKDVMENFRIKHGEEAMAEDSKTVLSYLLALYDVMKLEIANRSNYRSPVSRPGPSHSNKRFAAASSHA